ncbi:hypothetical protein COT52_00560 [candidate division WWE3 bacterium CG08_land_8_20_14_0_20_43_13]|uniref:DUF192 domain-containing protein n=1 Tax=candidate division WWE3 bacterium CG08_land_8_20_14_0_20_43_13 TaxID=1975087 RepID=A0A2H0X857_UNCKA|nr:MAG: hypothetical protein COT52_00560 [candidate division WWE3 bacterium CG08_land_8_20_14_0_20_43_13]
MITNKAIVTITVIFTAALLTMETANFFKTKKDRPAGISCVDTATFKDHTFCLELATIRDDQAKGLSGRSSITETEGMLFGYPTEDYYSFWMKDMLVPIDMLWLDSNGVVVNLETNVQPPKAGTADSELQVYRPNQKARYVLEIKAGMANKIGLSLGEKIELRFNYE